MLSIGKPQRKIDAWMLLKLSNNNRTNLHEWLEYILKDYYEEKEIEYQTSI